MTEHKVGTREEWRDRGHLLVARFLSPRVEEH